MSRRAALLLAALLPAAALGSEFCDQPGAVAEVGRIVDAQWKVFKDKKYAELEAFYSDLVAQHEAGRISDARLARFLGAFNQWEPWVEPLLLEWVKQYPRSYAARYALAMHYRAVGWGARGTDYAPKTSEEQFAGMQRAFRKAARVLDEAEALTTRPTLSAAMRIDMGAAGGIADPAAVYRAAIKAHPQTLQVRIYFIRKSQPKWGGSMAQLRAIIDEAKPLPVQDQRYIRYLALQEMGLAMEHDKNYPEAIRLLKESAALCSGVDASMWALSRVQVAHKDYQGAVETATEMIRRYPRSGEWHGSRGYAYQEMKKYKEAVADFQRGVDLAHPHSYLNLAYYYANGTVVPRDYKKAMDLFLIADGHKVKGAREEAERLSRLMNVPIR